MAVKKEKTKKAIAKKSHPKKKSSSKKVVSKKALPKPIGRVTHYYGQIKVAIIRFNKPFKAGTEIRFQGATSDFSHLVKSMQYDHKDIKVTPKGKEVGIKVGKRVREGDEVFEV